MREGAAEGGQEPNPVRTIAILGLVVLGALPIGGRFLPATMAWGFGHLAFLPLSAWIVALLAWILLFAPPVHRTVARFCYDILGRWLFEGSWIGAGVLALLAAGGFRLLATPTHLLGDGVLIGELAARGAEFRAHDGMDYLLHRLIIGWAGKVGSDPFSFSLYMWSSCIAGFAGVLTAILLLRRAGLPRQTKVFAFLLWLFSASTLLYCGYVESYSFLSVAMLGFLWSGTLADRGEMSPLVPAIFFGFALFFHTLALIAAPAFLWLILRMIRLRRWRAPRLALLLAPALLLPAAAIVIHVALGFDSGWFRREFVESKNQRQILIHLTGPDGILTWKYLKDVLNWLVLALPVAGWLFLTRIRSVRTRLREPGIAFLLIHAGTFAAAFVLMDRKLGPARDWDILTPQIGGIVMLAGLLWEKESVRPEGRGILPSLRFAAPWVALLFLWPWLAVNASRASSLERFTRIKADFATFPRSYATEELAKYYRDHGDLKRALALYEECVQIYPRSPRTRVLLGSSYFALDRIDDAIAQYDEALRIDPKSWLALDFRSKIALRKKDYPTALDLSRRLIEIRPGDPDAWGTRGYSALQMQQFAEAHDSFVKAARLRLDPQLYYYAGLTSAYLDRWDEAVDQLSRAVQSGGKEAVMTFAAAAAIEGRISARSGPPHANDRSEMLVARNLAILAADTAPADSIYSRYVRHIDRVLAGREKAANWLRP